MPAGRDVAQIDRRRAQPAHGARLADERAEQADDLVDARVHVVGKAGDEHGVDQRVRAATRAAARPFRNAPPPRSAVNSSLRVGIVDGGDLGDAVDLERERRAEDRQAVREVGRAVDRIEDPAGPRPASPAPPPISSAST